MLIFSVISFVCFINLMLHTVWSIRLDHTPYGVPYQTDHSLHEGNVDAQVAPDVSKALNEVMIDSVAPFTNDKMNDVYGVYDW